MGTGRTPEAFADLVATRTDGSVPFEQAESLLQRIPRARLVETTAPTHLLWFAGGDEADEPIRAFLAEPPPAG